MSQDARDAVLAFPEFITEPRGEISVKVKWFFVHFAYSIHFHHNEISVTNVK